MKLKRSVRIAVLMSLSVVLLTACSLVAQEVTLGPSYLVSYDFADAEIGTMPTGWKTNDARVGFAKIVAAPELPAGKALMGTSDGSDTADTHVRMEGTFGSQASGARTIGVEFKFKVIHGASVNLNLTSSQGHHVNLFLQGDGNRLQYRTSSLRDTGVTWEVGTWHHVRIIADKETSTFTLYFDNMEEPVGTFDFRVNLNTGWNNVHVLFLHSKGTASEVWYSDVKAWVVE